MTLTVVDHDRGAAGLRYVYPVLSRRAGGISIGLNLNYNQACNWSCAYCQVPNLTRGEAPPLDGPRFEAELATLLSRLSDPAELAALAPEGMREIKDLAFSGDGEPTSCRQFSEAVERAIRQLKRFQLAGRVNFVLITNGSFVDRPDVQAGLQKMARYKGELWFKLDRGDPAAAAAVNGVKLSIPRQLQRLRAAASVIPTWIQSCFFCVDGTPPPEAEIAEYLSLLSKIAAEGPRVQGVLLYSLARPSLRPGGERLSALSAADFEALAERIRATGLSVRAHR